MTDWTLCIDFGTAFSKAAAAPAGAWRQFDPASVRPLTLNKQDDQANAFLLDSAVFVGDDHIFFGRAAMAQAEAHAHKKRLPLRSFKTLLSVSDLDRALNTNVPPAIDPHRVFPMRDLVVLYLAYLLASTEQAIRNDPALSSANIERRYAAPAWRSGDSAGMHHTILRLFGEAEAFRASVGDKILSARGLSLRTISDALPAALTQPRMLEMGLVYEAAAAAAYTSIGLEDTSSHLIVVDMGAGTTDIAAVARSGERMEEVPNARVTLKQAGEFIDRVIANIVIEQNASLGSSGQSDLWRLLMMHMRDIKEGLYIDGQAVIRHEGKVVKVTMRDVERDKDFRAFVKALTEAYDESLEAVRDSAIARGRREIQAIAVGGGASAPFIQALLPRKPKRAAKLMFEPRPATPEWAFGPEFRGNLAPVFPQLAIAIGGALAPSPMLAVRAGVSQAATGRTDNPAGRD